MRTYPLLNGAGEMYAFEVDITAVSPRELGRVVSRRLGAVVTFGPQGFLARDDARLRFTHNAIEFEVSEPFGDNSRYWIGPAGNSPGRVAAIDDVHSTLENYKPGLLRRLASLAGA